MILKKLDFNIIPFNLENGQNFLTMAPTSATVMQYFLLKITQLTEEMTTINLYLLPKFTVIEFMLDRTDDRNKMCDLRKYKPERLQPLNNDT